MLSIKTTWKHQNFLQEYFSKSSEENSPKNRSKVFLKENIDKFTPNFYRDTNESLIFSLQGRNRSWIAFPHSLCP